MSPRDPRADRLADALDLLVHTGEDEIGRIRARITSLVAAVAADAQALVERHKAEGSDAVEASWVAMHVRDLAAAQRPSPRRLFGGQRVLHLTRAMSRCSKLGESILKPL